MKAYKTSIRKGIIMAKKVKLYTLSDMKDEFVGKP